ncbi:PspC domain-containing protein [Paenibacillus validus]|uniref:PspC domain-containing protein n=1 Tax=Paenibacillus validus TaxID=44253 RepID=UPI003D2E6BBA
MTKLYRSRTDRKITGLCGGLAETLGFDATLLRLLVVITTLFSGGVVIAIYVLAALVIPSEPWHGGPHGPGPGYGGGANPYGGKWDHQFGSWKDWKRAERHYRKAQRYGWGSPQQAGGYEAEYAASQAQAAGTAGSDLDDMMKDIEKKAMWKEIEELRAKVAQYEKQQQNQTKGEI